MPTGIRNSSTTEVIEAAHPIPDAQSLAGGARIFDVVSQMGEGDSLLLLVSGGASSLAEHPAQGIDLAALQEKNRALVASGLDIHAMNAERRKISRIKGGGLLAAFSGKMAQVLAVSDVEGDDIAVVGSGIGAAHACPAPNEVRIVASNRIAREAAAAKAGEMGFDVTGNRETLYADLNDAARTMGKDLQSATPGVLIWGGEPTTVLPENPGRGGRNQALAVALCSEINDLNGIEALIAGTDGTDGPTEDAGGFAAPGLWSAEAEDALRTASTGDFLEQNGLLFTTGPTGTNVMDLAIAIKT